MRVIAGTARGIRLESPKGLRVRPTLERVREALFSILMPRLQGCAFLDLFAGTGANGIEALSRGAAACTFVDTDERSLQTIALNLERTRLSHRAECLRLHLPDGLESLQERPQGYSIIFADPPHKFNDYNGLLRRIHANALLSPEGVFILEHDSHNDVADDLAGYHRTRRTIYGNTCLSFFS